MQSVQEIFSIHNSLLPPDWKWCTIYYMFGENQSQTFTNYGFTPDRTHWESGFSVGSEFSSTVNTLLHNTLQEISPPPLPQPTHVELTIESDGKFNTVVGYGEPNWDPAPRAWPDDITAENYTYTKAWPDGISDEIKEIFDDPRSLIGYD